MLALDVVLVEPHADIGRVDLDQFAQRILQPASDRDRAAQGGVVIGKFLSPQPTGRIDAGPRLVDDHIGHVFLGQLFGNQRGEEILGLAAGGPVADDRHRELETVDQFEHLLASLLATFLAPDQINHAMFQNIAELVQRHQLATALEARVDGQHAMVAHRRLQQQIAEILGKHSDRMRLGPIGQLAANFPFQARQDQPR